MDLIKNYSLFLLLSAAAVGGSFALDSVFLEQFFTQSLVPLLIALVAINTTARSALLAKLKEIREKSNAESNFSPTINEMRRALIEQIVLVFLAVILSVLLMSPTVIANVPFAKLILLTLIGTVFVASIHNIYDTANAVFIALEHENKT